MAFWKTLTGANVRLLTTEQTIMAQVSPLQTLDICMASAVDYVRGYVAAGGNTMETVGVPAECVDDAVTIARYTYLAQDPTGTLLTAIRQKEWDDALAHLRDIAKEISTVTQGDTGGVAPVGAGKWGSITRMPMRTETSLSPPP